MQRRSSNIIRPGSEPLSPGRRKIIRAVPLLLLAAGCDYSPSGTGETLLRSAQKLTDWVQMKVFDPTRPAPEYTDRDLTPETGFRVNDYDTDQPDIDLANWTLTVDGLVQKPGEYTLAQVMAFPKKIMNTRHCCVEGWSMIPKWGGTAARDFLQSVGADLTARYASVECGDDYYSPFDMASFLHPQTLLCYEAYGKPLTLEHGAPLRIVMPTKLGYKSSKWITRLTITNDKPGGYWEDQGYDWFAGI